MQYEQMVEQYQNDPVSFVVDFGKLKASNGMASFDFDGEFDNTDDLLSLFHRSNHVLMSKKRQKGISWTLVAFVAWYAMMNKDSGTVMVSENVSQSKALKSKMFFFLQNLSDHVEFDLNHYSEDISFFDSEPHIKLFNGSVVEFTSNIEMGTSASFIVADELQLFKDCYARIVRAIAPTMQKSILVGMSGTSWFDSYISDRQFVDSVRVVRL